MGSECSIRPMLGWLLGEVKRFECYSPGPILLPGETAVHCSTLYCYLFRLEHIFNPKTSLFVCTLLWPILFYHVDFGETPINSETLDPLGAKYIFF